MAYKWKPNKSQRREFAQNMQDDEFREAYYARREERVSKKRATSKFDYATAGGRYIPTKHQYNIAFKILKNEINIKKELEEACNMVISGYSCNEKVHHDYIHIVNEYYRNNY